MDASLTVTRACTIASALHNVDMDKCNKDKSERAGATAHDHACHASGQIHTCTRTEARNNEPPGIHDHELARAYKKASPKTIHAGRNSLKTRLPVIQSKSRPRLDR